MFGQRGDGSANTFHQFASNHLLRQDLRLRRKSSGQLLHRLISWKRLVSALAAFHPPDEVARHPEYERRDIPLSLPVTFSTLKKRDEDFLYNLFSRGLGVRHIEGVPENSPLQPFIQQKKCAFFSSQGEPQEVGVGTMFKVVHARWLLKDLDG